MSEGTGGSSLPAPRDPRIPERRFGDDEVSRILSRVSSRETRPDMGSGHDLTLSDLMAAAAEAGLDPGEVRRAAAMVPFTPTTAVQQFTGAPTEREILAALPGARIPADTYALVRRLEAATGSRGEVMESAPGTFEWRGKNMAGSSTFSLKERDGRLEVQCNTDRAGHYMGLWVLGLVAWAALSAATPLGALLPPLGKVLAFLLTPVLVARPFWAASDRRLRARLEDLVMDVLRLAEAEGPVALPDGEGDGA